MSKATAIQNAIDNCGGSNYCSTKVWGCSGSGYTDWHPPPALWREFLIQRDNLPSRLAINLASCQTRPRRELGYTLPYLDPYLRYSKAALWSRSNTVPQCPQWWVCWLNVLITCYPWAVLTCILRRHCIPIYFAEIFTPLPKHWPTSITEST